MQTHCKCAARQASWLQSPCSAAPARQTTPPTSRRSGSCQATHEPVGAHMQTRTSIVQHIVLALAHSLFIKQNRRKTEGRPFWLLQDLHVTCCVSWPLHATHDHQWCLGIWQGQDSPSNQAYLVHQCCSCKASHLAQTSLRNGAPHHAASP